MSNLIPKSLSKQKNVLYKFITWTDVIFLVVFAAIAVAFAFAINTSTVLRVIIGIIVFLFLMVLLIPINKNHDRIYQIIVFFIKIRSKYEKK